MVSLPVPNDGVFARTLRVGCGAALCAARHKLRKGIEPMLKKSLILCLAALAFAAAGPLFSTASFAEDKAKPNTARQEKAKSEPAKPEAATSTDKDSGAMDSGGADSEDAESDQPGGEGMGSQD
jgi:hypothetical protein